jgi:ankyrin repeat protein
MTPLFLATYRGRKESVRYLLSKGADVRVIPSPLIMAAGLGDAELVRILLDAGADVNTSGPFGTALHRASFSGNLEIARLLLEKKADVNARMTNGATPLFMAALKADSAVGALLTSSGADIDASNSDGMTALHLAIRNNGPAAGGFARLLIRLGAKLGTSSKDGDTPLTAAVDLGCTDIVGQMLDKGADARAAEKGSERTLLHRAAIFGYGDIVSMLLEHGLPAGAKDVSGKTAMDYAGFYGHRHMAAGILAFQAGKAKIRIKGLSTAMEKPLAEGEANVWRMRNRGWTVKTRNHLFVFDNEELGRGPDTPCLENGVVTPAQIRMENVLALYTNYHAEPGTLEFIHALEDSAASMTYIHYKGDIWRGNRNTVYLEGTGDTTIGNIRLARAEMFEETGMGFLHYRIKADGISVVYSGFHPADLGSYKKALDTFAGLEGPCDLAFVHVPEDMETGRPYIEALIEKLKPRVIVPMDAGRHRIIPRDAVEWISEKFPEIRVMVTENPGDRFICRRRGMTEINAGTSIG